MSGGMKRALVVLGLVLPDGSKHAGRCKFYDEAHERYEQEDA